MIKVTPFFHTKGLTTNYIVTDDDSRDAVLIDCTDVDMNMINFIEKGKYSLKGVFITHAHDNHACGLKKLMHIYTPAVYACLPSVQGIITESLYGNNHFECGSISASVIHIPGHSADSLVYVIDGHAFTGDVRPGSAGTIRNGKVLLKGIKEKLYALPDETVIYPAHGPVSTVEIEKRFKFLS